MHTCTVIHISSIWEDKSMSLTQGKGVGVVGGEW